MWVFSTNSGGFGRTIRLTYGENVNGVGMVDRHRTFISFHHANDESYKKIFELRFGNRFGVVAPGAVQDGEIDPNCRPDTIRRIIRDRYLRDTSVTVVLVGSETWKRKHVDWEISSSLRNTELNPRSGLLGILLPTHPNHDKGYYTPELIPPRLHDNIECGYSELIAWTNEPDEILEAVHRAYLRKGRVDPDNARPLFERNRT